MKQSWQMLFALPLVCSLGCRYGCPFHRAPGPIYQQRQSASLHDPYADSDIGPEVVGGRPREFQKPFAEPTRSRWLSESLWAR